MPRFKGASNVVTTSFDVSQGVGSLTSSSNAYVRISSSFFTPPHPSVPTHPLTTPTPHHPSQLLGVLVPGIALIIAGIVFLVFYLFAYACACCRCCGMCRNKEKKHRHHKRCAWMGVVSLALVNLALILAGISYLPGFGKGLQSVLDGTGSITTILSNSAALLSSPNSFLFTKLDGTTVTATSVFSSLTSAANTATDMYTIAKSSSCTINNVAQPTCCPSGCNNPQPTVCIFPVSDMETQSPTYDFCNALQQLAFNLNSSSNAGQGAAAPFTSAQTQLSTSIGKVPLDTAKTQVFMAGVIVLAVIAGVIALQSVMVCRSRAACCVFKGFALLSIVLTALVFVLAGIFFIVGLVGSDVCYAPGLTLTSLVGTLDPTNTLSYYLSCDANPAASLPVPIVGILAAQSALNDANSNIRTFTSSVTSSASLTASLGAGFSADATALNGYVPAANASLNLLLSDVVSCPALGGVFVTFFNGLCGGAITASIGLASLLTAAAALLALQMSFGVSVCCWHPGQEDVWEESPYAEGSGGGAPKQYPGELQLRVGAPVQQGGSVNY